MTDRRIIDRDGDAPTDWRLQVRDGHLEVARMVPYDGTLRITTEPREYVSHRKDSRFNRDRDDVLEFYEEQTGRRPM